MAIALRYGFNLGQIEGLDSSVKTVTLTVTDATESHVYTLQHTTDRYDNDLWTDDIDTGLIYLFHINGGDTFGLDMANFTESDIGDTYNVTISTPVVEENFKSAVETVLVDNGLISEPETLFDGTITITAEDTQGVEIPFDKDVSSYPLEKWTVTINGLEIPYEAAHNDFILESDNIGYSVFGNNGVYRLEVISMTGADYPPAPGDYQVKIVYTSESGGGGSSGLPDVSASDNGSVLGVVNGEWNTDSRLSNYPSVEPSYGSIYGIGATRFNEPIAKPIIPAPLDRNSYSDETFYLPFKDATTSFPSYIDVQLDERPSTQNFAYTYILIQKSKTFQFIHAHLSLDTAGTYTLKATVNNGSVTFSWVADT